MTGKPLFGMDYKHEGMLIAMIAHPPAFGMKVKSVNDAAARSMPGIKDVFTIKTLAGRLRKKRLRYHHFYGVGCRRGKYYMGSDERQKSVEN